LGGGGGRQAAQTAAPLWRQVAEAVAQPLAPGGGGEIGGEGRGDQGVPTPGMAAGWGGAVAESFLLRGSSSMAVSLESATLMCLTEAPWACATLPTLCNITNTYRRIRPSNPEWFRLARIACHCKRSRGCLRLATRF